MLEPGTRFGPYEIVAAIGRGGMGEVYRAKDTRLDRLVALKIVSSDVAGHPEFRARFSREAKTISSLNHPHVCALFDVGHGRATFRPGSDATGGPERTAGDGDVSFLVFEHLDGETLDVRLARGPLPINLALKIARELISALAAAHKQGIIHRDVKPSNVMLTASGSKLLDFGIAKPIRLPLSSAATTASSPQTAAVTAPGTLLGTFRYMAPEQIEGAEADARTDIFAFGAVLYEMLTGRQAFAAKNDAALFAAILKDEPAPVRQLVSTVTPAVEFLVRMCLAKDRDARFQNAHDVELYLQSIGDASDTAAVHRVRSNRRALALWGLLTFGIVAATALSVWRTGSEDRPQVVRRFLYDLPEAQAFSRPGRHTVVISPDGRRIVYVANQQLYLRELDKPDAQPIDGTNEDPMEPLFSPDGQSIAYFASGGLILKKITASGGTAVTLTKLPGPPYGASWSDQGLILFGMNSEDFQGVQAISENGGAVTSLLTVDPDTERAAQPRLLADREHVLFTVLPVGDDSGNESVVLHSLVTGQRRTLISGGADARVLSTGHIAYARDGNIFVVPFDDDRLAITGAAIRVVEGVVFGPQTGTAQFTVSREGTLVYRPGVPPDVRALVWVDRKGHEQSITTVPFPAFSPRISPDGNELALSAAGDIWIWSLAKQTLRRLTFTTAVEQSPVWMPGGRNVLFDSEAEGAIQLGRKAADGSGDFALMSKAGAGYPTGVTADGELVTFHTQQHAAMVLRLGHQEPPVPLVSSTSQTLNAVISPNGRWVAYQSNESGRFEVYVHPFPDVSGGRWQVSLEGGSQPAWSRDGRELFFISAPPPRMMSVSVGRGPVFTNEQPALLFPATEYLRNMARNYDVSRDGSRFVMLKNRRGVGWRRSLVIVSDWFAELQRMSR